MRDPSTLDYVVQPGDTLTSLAKRFYYNPEAGADMIYTLNRDKFFTNLGQGRNFLMAGVTLEIVSPTKFQPLPKDFDADIELELTQ